MCLIWMKYRIIIIIIIIISRGKILSSSIANPSHTHACTDVRTARAHPRTLTHTTPPPTTVAVRGAPNHDSVMVGRTLSDPGETMADRRLIEINNAPAIRPLRKFGCFFAYIQKILGRTETRTRDRICFQTIRSVRDIYRDDRARIATCTLRTPTDRHKENYSIDDKSPATSCKL